LKTYFLYPGGELLNAGLRGERQVPDPSNLIRVIPAEGPGIRIRR